MSEHLDLDYQTWAEEECVRRLKEHLAKKRAEREAAMESVSTLEAAPELRLVPPLPRTDEVVLTPPSVETPITLPTAAARVIKLHTANIELPG